MGCRMRPQSSWSCPFLHSPGIWNHEITGCDMTPKFFDLLSVQYVVALALSKVQHMLPADLFQFLHVRECSPEVWQGNPLTVWRCLSSGNGPWSYYPLGLLGNMWKWSLGIVTFWCIILWFSYMVFMSVRLPSQVAKVFTDILRWWSL